MARRVVERGGFPPFVRTTQHRISDQTRVVARDHCEIEVALVHLLDFHWRCTFVDITSAKLIVLLLFPEEISISTDLGTLY